MKKAASVGGLLWFGGVLGVQNGASLEGRARLAMR